MSIARRLADFAQFLNSGGRAIGPNLLINGGFDYWQRGVSFTGAVYGPDRWLLSQGVSTKVGSRQAFALGQSDVPGNPAYFLRTVVTSVAGAGAFIINTQRIEGVGKLAGRKATLTFWAKADAAKKVGLELYQHFGGGGSPSPAVSGIGTRVIDITTSWAKYSFTFDVPSIVGKVLGTDGEDYLAVHFWFDAGSNFSARVPGLGQQSGTFDLARVSLVEGDASKMADPFQDRLPAQEFLLCQRYYQQIGEGIGGHTSGTASVRLHGQFGVPMRVNPGYELLRTSFQFLQGNSVKNLSGVTVAFARVKSTGFRFSLSNTGDTALTANVPGEYYEDAGPLFAFSAEL